MAVTFRSIIADLWASFGQAAPDLDDDAIELRSDDVTLRLESFRDEQILVSVEVAPLSSERMRRAEQIRTIMQDDLGLLLARRGCVHLAADAGSDMLMISGLHGFAEGRQRLSQLIDDMLYLRAWHVDTLRGSTAPKFPIQSQEGADVVFRP